MTREVEARLKISAVDRTGRVFQSLAGRMQQVNRQASALNRQQSMVGRSATSMMAAVGRIAAPAALTAFATSAVKEFAAVERQMTRIGITAGSSSAETEAAFSRMQQVSKDMALPVDSAIEALDTLVSSGLSLKEAMDFLPSVLATAQASGSATQDIANTAIKASSALKIEAGQMQRAFDVMVTGGKAGQFELKDMAAYIPELANSFASLGYTGEDGLKQLIAILQTLREDTGDASAAATQAQNIFGKMFSSDTAKKFSSFGINLRKELEAARKNGEDAVSAFVRLSKEAIDGDLSKLPLLFTDQEFRLGMQSLITSADSYKRFVDAVNSSEVDGTVMRDVKRVTDDAQASIDRAWSSWERLKNSIGGKIAPAATSAMDFVSNETDYQAAVDRALDARGMGFLDKEWWKFQNTNGRGGARGNETEESDRMAMEGGFNRPSIRSKYEQGPRLPAGWKAQKEFPGGGTGALPLPVSRPTALPSMPERLEGVPAGLRPSPTVAAMGQVSGSFFRVPSRDELKDALKIDASGLKDTSDEAAQKVAEGGRAAGQAIEESAAFFKVAGVDVGAALMSAAEKMLQAANKLNSAQVAVANAAINGRSNVNADTGRSMPAVAASANGAGGR
ncbi:phage tail tape measure protein [Sinorhizobium sp. BG8]|uniref:phage tail tape measure protein n=1 Tax=Sinorhizobium sp. BG8 TaxID=2613773 RepID=UPI00193CBED0|nr:phage tail tape measure protein [Sinorhizobium sp. BG8]QRM55149.1 phage tail tape measure protein [Sinorhizobium sp. BG8]